MLDPELLPTGFVWWKRTCAKKSVPALVLHLARVSHYCREVGDLVNVRERDPPERVHAEQLDPGKCGPATYSEAKLQSGVAYKVMGSEDVPCPSST